MPRELLTDVKVRSLEPRSQAQYDVFDEKVRGLSVRVSPKGRKAWVVHYRVGRLSQRFTMGSYPAMGLATARKSAQETLRDVALGKNPAREKQVQRRDPFAFDAFVETFIETYAKQKNKAWVATQHILQRRFVRPWGKRDIRHITKADVTAILDRILDDGQPSATNQAFAHLRKLFNWGVERGILDSSPCAGLTMPAKAKSRDRVVSDSELRAIWAATREISYPFGPFVRLLILTGQRRDEVASMEWVEIDRTRKIWSIPAARTKGNKAHEVPLSAQALAELSDIPRSHDILVFPGRGCDNPISGFSKFKKSLDQTSKTEGWTLHDLRRTVATGMAQLKVPPHVVERILNHTSGSLGGVAGVYNRFGYLDEMRDALDRWADRVETVTNIN